MKSLFIGIITVLSVAAFATESSVISQVFNTDAVKQAFEDGKILNIALDTVDNSAGSTSERVHTFNVNSEKEVGSSTESCQRMIEVLEQDDELAEIKIEKAICQ